MKNKRTLKLLLLCAMNFIVMVLLFVTPQISLAQAIPLPNPLRPQTSSNTLPQYNQGVDLSIKDYLCTPEGNGTDLFNCVNRLTKFAISAGSIVLVFLIVLAGYMYIAGGEAQKSKAKSMVFSSLTGMVIILVSFTLLNFINPSLLQFKPIQPPIFTSANLPKCEDIGFSSNCIISTGPASGQISIGNNIPGSANEAQYRDLISKYAQANGLEYCHLSALMQKESTYNRYITSNPSHVINPSSDKPPTYGLNFNVFHAIGLTQVTIYPKNKGGWAGETPARSSAKEFGKSPLTLEMLLDPETNISAGAKYFGQLMKSNNGNFRIAYDDFQSGPGDTGAPGKPDSDPKTLDKIVEMYTACKKRS